MTTVVNPRTWVDGEAPNWKEYKDEVYDPIYLALHRPKCHVVVLSTQSLPSSTDVTIQFSQALVDTAQMWDSSQNTRITCTLEGRYRGYCGSSWILSSLLTGIRRVMVMKNGTTTVDRFDGWAGDSGRHRTFGRTFEVYLEVGDYLTLRSYQNSGSTTTLENDTDLVEWSAEMYVRWKGAV